MHPSSEAQKFFIRGAVFIIEKGVWDRMILRPRLSQVSMSILPDILCFTDTTKLIIQTQEDSNPGDIYILLVQRWPRSGSLFLLEKLRRQVWISWIFAP